MQSKALPRPSTDLRADRELQLTQFIEAGLANLEHGLETGLLLVARSPESTACRAVFALSGTLAERGITARIILMAAEPGKRWNLAFAPGFQHEVRLGLDHRLLDAHEQIVIGTTAIWYGDSMRREPERRDAFIQFINCNAAANRGGRMTFASLWAGCRPLYDRAVTCGAAETCDAALAQEVLATLGDWQPSTGH